MKAIVFDLNGVLIDSNKFNADLFYKIFSEYGKDVGKKAAIHYLSNGGIPRKKRMEMYLKNFAKVEPNIYEIERVLKKFSQLLEAGLKDIPIKTCVKDFLKNNYGKYIFFVSSGAIMQDVKKILEAKELLNFFEKIYGSPQHKYEHLYDIINSYGIDKDDLIFFGDSIHDKNAADKVGVKFIAVRTNENDWQNYDNVIKNFCELVNYKFLR